uniref:Alpha/beta hydrolase n=1 Tax=Desulfobacca acetoxidans TaxID=60893 RepID=A0A7V4LDV0_9BACT
MRETIFFENSRGFRLSGYWEVPAGRDAIFPVVVFAHDSGSSKDDPLDARVARELLAGGIIPLRFDFTGTVSSDGSPQDASADQWSDDLLWALDYAFRRGECSGSIGIHAAGTGARAALTVALTDLRLSALALRSPRAEAIMPYATMVNIPTLIISGSADPRHEAVVALYNDLRIQKRLAVIENATERYEGANHADKVAEQTVKWFVEHLVPVEVQV